MGKSFKDSGKGHRKESKYAEKKKAKLAAKLDSDEQPPFVPAPVRPPVHRAPVMTNPVLPPGPTPEKQMKTTLIKTASIKGDGKIFYVDAVNNERGDALRIAEVSKGKRTIIMIPACLLREFIQAQGSVVPALDVK